MALSHDSQHYCCNVCIYHSPFVLILPVHTTKEQRRIQRSFPPEFRLSKPLQPDYYVSSSPTILLPHPTSYLCHTLYLHITLYPCIAPYPHTLVSLHTLASLHLSSFPHVTSPPSSTISISHRLLATTPGDYPLPLNCTLRASLGLHFDQALLLTSSNLSQALGTSPDLVVTYLIHQ